MTRTLAVLATAAALGAVTMAAPAQAHWHGASPGLPGLAFGLAAGAITAGAIAATSPYHYGPGYYYGAGPAYGYGPGPYAYYGGPYYYRHHYWRYHW